MEGIPATYLGRIVSKDKFRAYIYASDGSQKLVNSWDEFEANIATGLWFASKQEIQKPVSQDVIHERIRKPRKTVEVETEKTDDFLPKE